MDKRTCKERYADHEAAIRHLEANPQQGRSVQKGLGVRAGESFNAVFYRVGRIAKMMGTTVSITNIDWYAFGEDMAAERTQTKTVGKTITGRISGTGPGNIKEVER